MQLHADNYIIILPVSRRSDCFFSSISQQDAIRPLHRELTNTTVPCTTRTDRNHVHETVHTPIQLLLRAPGEKQPSNSNSSSTHPEKAQAEAEARTTPSPKREVPNRLINNKSLPSPRLIPWPRSEFRVANWEACDIWRKISNKSNVSATDKCAFPQLSHPCPCPCCCYLCV